MTQEEKAKAYDEALKKARELYNEAKEGEFFTIMSDYEEIFPQLAESEEERIRKALIEVFKKKLERGFEWVEYGIPNRSVLDWLEKQKEQKPSIFPPGLGEVHWNPIPSGKDVHKWNLPEDFEEAVYKVANFISPFDSQDELRRVSHRFAEQLMSLAKKELVKKPAEWGEEDEAHRDFILESLEDQIRFCKKDAEGAHYTKQIRAAQNWLKSLPLNLKKKNEDVAKLCSNEWSEEDEKIAKEIEEELWYPGDFPDYPSKEENELYDDCQRRLDWFKNKLKSLRPQPKQEWSGEDERKLQKCIKIVERWEDDYDIAYSPYSNLLKSLRPQPQGVYKLIVHNIYAMLKDKDFMASNHHWMAHLLNDIRVRCKNADEEAEILTQPHWKPNKEQMEAFEKAVTFFKTKWTETKVKEQLALVSLYNDLNVLIEEE